MLKHRLYGSILKVLGVSVLAQDTLHQDTDTGASWLALHPVDTDAFLQVGKELVGDDAELVVAHDLDRALVFGKGVVECNLVLGEPLLFPALPGRTDVLGQVDELLDYLGRRNGVVVVGPNLG